MLLRITNIDWLDATDAPEEIVLRVTDSDTDRFTDDALKAAEARYGSTILDADVAYEAEDDTTERLRIIQEWLATNAGNDWVTTTAKIKTRELLNQDKEVTS